MMKTASDLMLTLKSETGMERLAQLYGCKNGKMALQLERYMILLKRHADLFGHEEAPLVISAPGRTELCGNHTDHNNGLVMAAAVNLDTVAAVNRRGDLRVNLYSEGFPPVQIDLSSLSPVAEEQGKPASIIRGIANKLHEMGLKIGGFDASATSNVLTGSGLSSSAAFEVLVVAIFDALYNGMQVDAVKRAEISQYAENVYFGKPSGLMDQMASSVGGLVAIDFKDAPKVKPLQMDLGGYSLVVVNTGGSHDDLTADYAAVRQEMNAVARCFGEEVLRRVRPEQLWQDMARVKAEAGDRAVLRAYHYFTENDRVRSLIKAVEANDVEAFKRILIDSGRSSWMYLQNLYANPANQSLGVALVMAEDMLSGRGAWRVHGGGFAGTTLNLVPQDMEERFVERMNAVFGDHACHVLNVRREGAAIVF
ncbi:MAG: galactokinase [Clostridia bacterium]|nr:galactokinase [Clostridia bacterium]